MERGHPAPGPRPDSPALDSDWSVCGCYSAKKLSETIAISAYQKSDNKPIILHQDISKLLGISDVSDKE